MDYCSAGPQYASGGFIADSAFSGGTVVNGSQQQYIVRNSQLDGWSNGVWNQVFSGDVGAPSQSFSGRSGQKAGATPYTSLATSPVSEEEPFLQTDGHGIYSVFVPAMKRQSAGPSWTGGATPGTSLSIGKIPRCRPRHVRRVHQCSLASGRSLILTPGVYALKAPILVVGGPTRWCSASGSPPSSRKMGPRPCRWPASPGVKLSG